MKTAICKPRGGEDHILPSWLSEGTTQAKPLILAFKCLLSLLSVDVSGQSPSPLSRASVPPSHSFQYHPNKLTSKHCIIFI